MFNHFLGHLKNNDQELDFGHLSIMLMYHAIAKSAIKPVPFTTNDYSFIVEQIVANKLNPEAKSLGAICLKYAIGWESGAQIELIISKIKFDNTTDLVHSDYHPYGATCISMLALLQIKSSILRDQLKP